MIISYSMWKEWEVQFSPCGTVECWNISPLCLSNLSFHWCPEDYIPSWESARQDQDSYHRQEHILTNLIAPVSAETQQTQKLNLTQRNLSLRLISSYDIIVLYFTTLYTYIFRHIRTHQQSEVSKIFDRVKPNLFYNFTFGFIQQDSENISLYVCTPTSKIEPS